jgi:ATP-dependent helicase HrpA
LSALDPHNITDAVSHYRALLDDVTTKDHFRLSRQWRTVVGSKNQDNNIQQKNNQKTHNEQNTLVENAHWQALTAKIDASHTRVQQRRNALPEVTYPDDLPISEKRDLIAETIALHQVVVLTGETGSGKTTQLPKICLSIGRGVRGMIGHTQPRRIAARTVATRIAEELNTPLGESVGYQVRFTDKASDNTHIKLMTDGILLAEIQQDRFLSRYDTIIIDEAHERSLNIDFLMGYLKQLLPKRPDLKVIITSATIDVEKFSKHFNDAPVIEVSGRTYAVEVRYRPPLDTANDDEGVDILSTMLTAIDEIRSEDTSGDMLIFFSGEREIREAALMIRRAQIPHVEVLPLYARLTVAEQNKIFQSHRGQRVVLSTNVAETALTVPGIRYVIDTGVARVSRYSFRTKVQRLPIEPISQASANQRKGRCGRVSEGICIRLYSEDDFNQRPEFTDAEILRTNLAAVILQMSQLKLGDIRHFPFVDPPDHRLINDGNKLLEELQALDAQGKLLPLGRQLATLPVDPRLGRMLLAAKDKGCLHEMAIIVSALSVQDPRERPGNKQQAADQAHRQWWDEKSDFIAYLNLWAAYEEQRQDLSGNQLQKWCKKQYIAYMRMREWRDIHTQICVALKRIGFTVHNKDKTTEKNDSSGVKLIKQQPVEKKSIKVQSIKIQSIKVQGVDLKDNNEVNNYADIHSALLSGLLGYIGFLSEEKGTVGEYLGTRNRRFSLFPGSSQFKKKPKWMVAGQLLETSKLYAHNAAKVDPQWILDNAQHLIKRHHAEPHYTAKSGQVMAFEKITLYGITLIEKQSVSYGPIDPKKSREIFIRAALVEGQYGDHGQVKQRLARKPSSSSDFFIHQQTLLNDLNELEAKSRRRDIVVDEEILFAFYDARVPIAVVNLSGFEHWRKTVEKTEPTLLFIDRDALMQHDASDITEAQFPNAMVMEGYTLPLSYHFEPNHPDDGVSVHVPVTALHLIKYTSLEWLVPGLLREKCIAMIKALPKQWRKNFVPVPSCVDKALGRLFPKQHALADGLSAELLRQTGVKIPNQLWNNIQLDSYYQMNIIVVDQHQKKIDSGRDLSVLKERYRDHVQEHLQIVGDDFEREGLTEWDFECLPESHEIEQQGMSIRAYPALVDRGHCVDIKLYDNPQEALVDSVKGMVRLAVISQKETTKYLHKNLFKGKELGLSMVDIGAKEKIVDDIICAAVKQVCFNSATVSLSLFEQLPLKQVLVRDRAVFEQVVEQGRSMVVARAELLASLLVKALAQVVAIKKAIKQAKNPLAMAYAAGDVQLQLQQLFYKGMIYHTPYFALQQYSRYLKAIELRLDKVAAHVNKDRALMVEISQLIARFDNKVQQLGYAEVQLNDELHLYRWMFEELRVSFFAQTVKTVMPVSTKRINKQWTLC